MSQTEIPATMCAVVTRGHGGIEQLEYREDWPTPIAAPGEALIEVGACGLNNTDINTRSGWYAKSVREGTTVTGGTQGFIETEMMVVGGSQCNFQESRALMCAGGWRPLEKESPASSSASG